MADGSAEALSLLRGECEGRPIIRDVVKQQKGLMTKPKKEPPILKILTVDDEIGIDSFFYEFFTARNYEVFNASSGKEALDVVRKEKPKVVLLDINMRGMDGLETLKKIKEIDKNIVVIMVTGVKNDEVMREAFEAGASEYITKPLSLEYLDKVVFLKYVNMQINDLGKI